MQGGAVTPAGIVAAPNVHSRHLNRASRLRNFSGYTIPGKPRWPATAKSVEQFRFQNWWDERGGEGDSVHVGTVIDILRFGTNETRIDPTTAHRDIRLIKGNKNSSCTV